MRLECEYCGCTVYETSTPGVLKCSGCGEITNDWGDDEDEEGD